MPADIVGTNIVQEHAHGGTFFEFQPGPIFANVVLADEINRATPKTQSALLEAMQDVSVSVGKTTYKLEQPFLVLATQNPLEMEGTYPLPEAQLDRFFFKLKVMYPPEEPMHQILERTTQDADPTVTRVVDGPEILEMRHVARAVPIARPVQAYAIRLTLGTHPDSPYATPLVKRYVRYGASPRAAQALVLGGQDPRAQSRPGVRLGRRHPRRGAAGAAPPRSCSTSKARPTRSTPTRSSNELLARRERGQIAPVRRYTRAPWPFDSKTTSSRSWSTCTSSRGARSPGRTAPIGCTPKRGRGIEFADHRQYTPGDDFRHIDWKAYKRLEPAAAAAVRRGAGPADLPDARRQPIDGGAGEVRPGAPHRGGALLHRPRASRSHRRSCRSAHGLGHESSPGRGKGRIFRVFELLEQLEAGGPTDLRESFKEFASRPRPAGARP